MNGAQIAMVRQNAQLHKDLLLLIPRILLTYQDFILLEMMSLDVAKRKFTTPQVLVERMNGAQTAMVRENAQLHQDILLLIPRFLLTYQGFMLLEMISLNVASQQGKLPMQWILAERIDGALIWKAEQNASL
jgi:hypothetical protein